MNYHDGHLLITCTNNFIQVFATYQDPEIACSMKRMLDCIPFKATICVIYSS